MLLCCVLFVAPTHVVGMFSLRCAVDSGYPRCLFIFFYTTFSFPLRFSFLSLFLPFPPEEAVVPLH